MLSNPAVFLQAWREPQSRFAASAVAAPSSWHAEASSQRPSGAPEKVQQQARTPELAQSAVELQAHGHTEAQCVAQSAECKSTAGSVLSKGFGMGSLAHWMPASCPAKWSPRQMAMLLTKDGTPRDPIHKEPRHPKGRYSAGSTSLAVAHWKPQGVAGPQAGVWLSPRKAQGSNLLLTPPFWDPPRPLCHPDL